jgi:hypothetical protein
VFREERLKVEAERHEERDTKDRAKKQQRNKQEKRKKAKTERQREICVETSIYEIERR